MLHISTSQTFDCFELDDKIECPYCLNITKQSAGYLGVRCHNCNQINSGDEWIGEFCKHYRRILKKTKSELGTLFGVSKHTIHSYENRKCPDKYFNWIKDKVKLLNSPNNQITRLYPKNKGFNLYYVYVPKRNKLRGYHDE